MTDETFLIAKCDANLRYYENRARQERAAAEAATSPEAASAHRLLAIGYEAEAGTLREQLKATATHRG